MGAGAIRVNEGRGGRPGTARLTEPREGMHWLESVQTGPRAVFRPGGRPETRITTRKGGIMQHDVRTDGPNAGTLCSKLGIVLNWVLIVFYSLHLVDSWTQLQSEFNSPSLFQLAAPSSFGWPRNWRKRQARKQQIKEFVWRRSLYVGVWGLVGSAHSF